MINAIIITTGTKIPDTLSASFCAGAFVVDASLTVFIISARTVLSLDFVARHFKSPLPFIVEA